MPGLHISLDGLPQLQRQFSGLELLQVPFATMQAINTTAFEVHRAWSEEAGRVFDRPVPLTRKAVRWKKATRENLVAVVSILDHVGKGTAPADYLRSQVEGGERKAKGLEAGLRRAGLQAGNERAILGKSAPTDPFGNIKSGVVQQILSQVSGQFDRAANETETSRAKRLKQVKKLGLNAESRRGAKRDFFVVRGVGKRAYTVNKDGSTTQSKLLAGIYQRIHSAHGTGIRPVFIFAAHARYKPRYDIFAMARREVTRRFPAAFERELAKAVASSKFNRGSA